MSEQHLVREELVVWNCLECSARIEAGSIIATNGKCPFCELEKYQIIVGGLTDIVENGSTIHMHFAHGECSANIDHGDTTAQYEAKTPLSLLVEIINNETDSYIQEEEEGSDNA
ncbi:hypothetical protein CIG75_12940 [Tumebacillus algifaecis]|uniref:Uncharacterized protein n=1 Tax=Tumebacillus algifaecis TaxID=1214604 RepID=A0A223D2S7_9BACL|nr:hypothetical protein [Tumebacillus algifaecis]ASS75805.1 hypothetical protein CIG75_12940 [Tumebacillus algifaecis]